MHLLYENTRRNNLLYSQFIQPILNEYKLTNSNTQPHIVLGEDTWITITDHQPYARGTTVWIDNERYIATYSLEQILQNPNLFIDFFHDITIPILYPVDSEPKSEVNIIYAIPNPSELSGVVAFDLETTGYNSIRNKILLISISATPDTAYIILPDMWESPIGIYRLKELFNNPDIQWLAHNGKFDIRFLRNQLNIIPHLAHDTMILHYVLDERTGTHGLKQLCNERLALPDYEAELHQSLKGKRKKSFADVPEPILHQYAAKDSIYTLALYNQLMAELADQPTHADLYKVYQFIMDASNHIGDIENNGLLIDQTALFEVETDLTKRIEELKSQLIEMTDYKVINPNSNKQIGEYLYTYCKYRIPKVKSSTDLPCDKEAIEKLHLLYPDSQFLSNLIEYREMCKILSTYIIGVKDKIDPDNRIRTDYKLHGTVTGRLSSSEPNLQNIPRPGKNKFSGPIRNMFTVPDGYCLVGADLAQAELRVAAYLSKEDSMRDAWLAGVDMHTKTALDIFGGISVTSEQRTIGKTLNFSVLFGKQASTLATEWRIPVSQAQGYLDKFFAGKPKLKLYLDNKKNEAQETCQVISSTGRIRRFGMITDANLNRVLNQAINSEIQGIAGDINTLAACWMNQYCKDNQPTSKVILMVHDSIFVECEWKNSTLVRQVLCDFMCAAGKQLLGGDWIPIKADAKIGQKWGNL